MTVSTSQANNPVSFEAIENASIEELSQMDWDFPELDTDLEEGEGTPSPEAISDDADPVVEDEPVAEELASDGDGSSYDIPAQDEATDEPTTNGLPEEWQFLINPIKGGGDEITLNSPEEALSLIQKGIGFHKGMQEIAPHRKAIKTLEKANMLDPSKLNFAIDLINGNPEAIRKLIADNQVSYDDLDREKDPIDYTPTDHTPSDAVMTFDDTVANLQSSVEGAKTLDIITKHMDRQSQHLFAKQPEQMNFLMEQVKDGTYDKIANEINRQKIVGTTPLNEPFITSYNRIGEQMFGNGQAETMPPPQAKNPKPVSKPDQSGRNKVARTRNVNSEVNNLPTIESLEKLSMEDFDKEFEKLFGFK